MKKSIQSAYCSVYLCSIYISQISILFVHLQYNKNVTLRFRSRLRRCPTVVLWLAALCRKKWTLLFAPVNSNWSRTFQMLLRQRYIHCVTESYHFCLQYKVVQQKKKFIFKKNQNIIYKHSTISLFRRAHQPTAKSCSSLKTPSPSPPPDV